MGELVTTHCLNLVIEKFRCEPDEISRTLGLSPTDAWKAGDRRRPGACRMPWNYWDYAFAEREGYKLKGSIDELLALLTPLSDRLRVIGESARVEIQLVVFTTETNARIVAPPALAQFAAAAGARLASYFYYVGDYAPDHDHPDAETLRAFVSDDLARDDPERLAEWLAEDEEY